MSAGSGQESINRQACASCKHQRKKCKDDCVLFAHFPAERSDQFQTVHKVFGVSNMTKMLEPLHKQHQKEAVESFLWEAEMWKADRVRGPLGCYRRLAEENESLKSNMSQLIIFMKQRGLIGSSDEASQAGEGIDNQWPGCVTAPSHATAFRQESVSQGRRYFPAAEQQENQGRVGPGAPFPERGFPGGGAGYRYGFEVVVGQGRESEVQDYAALFNSFAQEQERAAGQGRDGNAVVHPNIGQGQGQERVSQTGVPIAPPYSYRYRLPQRNIFGHERRGGRYSPYPPH